MKSGQIRIKDAQCSEAYEKSILQQKKNWEIFDFVLNLFLIFLEYSEAYFDLVVSKIEAKQNSKIWSHLWRYIGTFSKKC